MTDRIVIPLPGIGTLDMPRAVFDQHLRQPAPAEPVAATATREVLDADALEERTGIPASWWMAQARERRVPFLKFGRYVRFDVAEVMACDAYRRRALPTVCTGHENRKGGASD
jgi:hypothetical protein